MGGVPLNLTAQQQQKLSALETASRAQSGQLIGQIQQLRRKLGQLYRTYSFDVGEARRLNRDINRVQGQLLDLHLSEQQQLHAVLTPDQFAQLQAAMHKPAAPDDRRPEGDSPWADHDMDHSHGHRWPSH